MQECPQGDGSTRCSFLSYRLLNKLHNKDPQRMLCLQQPRRLLVNAHEEGIPRRMSLCKGQIGGPPRPKSILSQLAAHGIGQRPTKPTTPLVCNPRFSCS